MFQHLLRHVTRNVHDCLVTGAALSQFRDQSVSAVVPPTRYTGICPNVPPRRLQGGNRPAGIFRLRIPKREHIPFGSSPAEFPFVSFCVFQQSGQQSRVEGYGSAFSALGFASAHREESFLQIYLRPGQRFDLGIAHSCV